MKYLIRAIKYFIYFSVICALIIAVLILTGMAEGNIDTIFRNGAADIWKIAGLFLLISAIYPKVGFIVRNCKVEGGLDAREAEITAFMEEHAYRKEKAETGKVTYRRRSPFTRLTRMYEDRITLVEEDGEVYVEGLRKDVVRIAMGLEYRFAPKQEN